MNQGHYTDASVQGYARASYWRGFTDGMMLMSALVMIVGAVVVLVVV